MGLSLTPPQHATRGGRVAAARGCVARVRAWCATGSSSTPGCCPTCSARRGPTRVAGTFDAPLFWSGLARRRARGRRRRGVQRVLRFAHGHRPRVQSARTCRRCPTRSSGSASRPSRGALAVGVYLTVHGGWPILAFALLGGAAAIFYVAPPIRWAYRGLGELVIALSYGPWMVLGSLYLHTRTHRLGRVLARRSCRASSSWRSRSSTRFPISTRTGSSASATSSCASGAGARSCSISGSPRRGSPSSPIGVAAGMFPPACLAALAAAAAARRERTPRSLDLRDAARIRAGDPQHRRLLRRRRPLFTAAIALQGWVSG